MSAFEQAIELRDKILRGDIVIGILPPEAFDEMSALFTEAGEAGNAQAWVELGNAHANGLNTWEPDPWEAVSAYEKAWDIAQDRAAGLAFAKTAYFQRMDSVSMDKLRHVVETLCADDEDGEATVLTGWMTYNGYAFEQNAERAMKLHRAAADKGNPHAMFELYVLYSTGQGVDTNVPEARAWCEKAANAGSPRAMYNMGALYAMGEGVDQDDAQAVAWYEKAANLGHGRAAGTLSLMYATGDGVAKDAATAEKYYNQAWENGYDAWELFDAMDIDPPFEL